MFIHMRKIQIKSYNHKLSKKKKQLNDTQLRTKKKRKLKVTIKVESYC